MVLLVSVGSCEKLEIVLCNLKPAQTCFVFPLSMLQTCQAHLFSIRTWPTLSIWGKYSSVLGYKYQSPPHCKRRPCCHHFKTGLNYFLSPVPALWVLIATASLQNSVLSCTTKENPCYNPLHIIWKALLASG